MKGGIWGPASKMKKIRYQDKEKTKKKDKKNTMWMKEVEYGDLPASWRRSDINKKKRQR